MTYKATETKKYKGHTITKIVDGFGQEFFIIDGNDKIAHFSFADAKRAINGTQTKYYPIEL